MSAPCAMSALMRHLPAAIGPGPPVLAERLPVEYFDDADAALADHPCEGSGPDGVSAGGAAAPAWHAVQVHRDLPSSGPWESGLLRQVRHSAQKDAAVVGRSVLTAPSVTKAGAARLEVPKGRNRGCAGLRSAPTAPSEPPPGLPGGVTGQRGRGRGRDWGRPWPRSGRVRDPAGGWPAWRARPQPPARQPLRPAGGLWPQPRRRPGPQPSRSAHGGRPAGGRG